MFVDFVERQKGPQIASEKRLDAEKVAKRISGFPREVHVLESGYVLEHDFGVVKEQGEDSSEDADDDEDCVEP